MTDEDAKLASILRAPERPADRAFVQGVMSEVLLEERLRAARAASWQQFWKEAAATVAVIAAALVLSSSLAEAQFSGILVLALLGSWVLMIRPQAAAFS
jgi:hypothetical protein